MASISQLQTSWHWRLLVGFEWFLCATAQRGLECAAAWMAQTMYCNAAWMSPRLNRNGAMWRTCHATERAEILPFYLSHSSAGENQRQNHCFNKTTSCRGAITERKRPTRLERLSDKNIRRRWGTLWTKSRRQEPPGPPSCQVGRPSLGMTCPSPHMSLCQQKEKHWNTI